MALNHILLVSYLFPPSGGVGVQRVLSYTRYLPDYGCRVFVVAARGGSCPVTDPDLLRLVPPSATVSRAFTPELSYAFRDRLWKGFAHHRQPSANHKAATATGWKSAVRRCAERLFSPDPQWVWTPFAIREASRLIRRYDIGTVLVTAPPFSALGAGVALKRRFPHIRLISEFRDEWVGYYIVELQAGMSDYRKRLAVERERETVEASDFVIAVTPTQARSIHSRYPREPESKFISISNGYDPELFRDFQAGANGSGAMMIAHVGTVYDNRANSPRAYLEAAGSLPEHVRSRIETVFIGRVAVEAAPLLENASCRVRTLGFLPQRQALSRLQDVDYCLLISDSMSAHSGKVFEYLATGKPILALTPSESEAARILRETGTAVIVDPGDVAGIRAALLAAFERFRSGTPVTPDWDAIRVFERPRLVGQFVRAVGIGSAGW